jgi:NitT/TauT family transport system substrate-binding protein
VLGAFLQAQLDATDFLNDKPLEAARIVAQGSGLPEEVVYLYNGPGGTSFDTTLKPSLVEALKSDIPYLKSIGDFDDLDVDKFVVDEPLRAVLAARGLDDAALRARTANPSLLRGDPALASELWLDGAETTQTTANPTSLLQALRDATSHGAKVRAAYVPDAELGTRWFADKAVWVKDAQNYLAFGTAAGANRYLAGHPGGVVMDYQQALGGSV